MAAAPGERTTTEGTTPEAKPERTTAKRTTAEPAGRAAEHAATAPTAAAKSPESEATVPTPAAPPAVPSVPVVPAADVAPPTRDAGPVSSAPPAAGAPTVPAQPPTRTHAPRRTPATASRPAAKSATKATASATARTFGPYSPAQWIGATIIIGVALACLALLLVAIVRGVLSLPALQDFVKTYPGDSPLPKSAPVGIPAWLGWQHFCNVFLMVLIIRSGIQVRQQKRPPAYWTSKRNPQHKVSITVWLHQGLDLFWMLNGVVFVVLLFSTGQWMRIVPTSWDVFPNAVSATLQYLSMNWPTENGWVDYNALQQLAYFATVFLAAPLAAATGFRMSGLWPSKAARLGTAYPIEWARRLHFPIMLYFVAFIMVHVTLVFSTGALRNLNHMYAARGSTDPNAYTGDWTGFWMLVASLIVIAAAWIAARPTVIAPIARVFGTVSSR